jgi:phage shock protein PspC (stress-responsive transcriptional regulator)
MTDDPTTRGAEGPLRRSSSDRMLAGVAGGLAQYFDVDPTLVRLGIVALTLFGGAGVPLYAAAWLLLPEEGSGESIAQQALRNRRSA